MSTAFTFRPAEKRRAKLRMALCGPAGSGKTMSALKVAEALVPGGRIALIDTERGSSDKYGPPMHTFDVLDLTPPYDPARYREAITAASDGGYDVVIIDSFSHVWDGPGGVLEIADRAGQRMRGNTWAGWATATPALRELVDVILAADAHVIATMRTRTEWVEGERNGKKTYERVGTAPVMRQGVEYEFDIVGDIDLEHTMHITKSRFADIASMSYRMPGAEFGGRLRAWLEEGSTPTDPVHVARHNDAVARFGKDTVDLVMAGTPVLRLANDDVWARLEAALVAKTTPPPDADTSDGDTTNEETTDEPSNPDA